MKISKKAAIILSAVGILAASAGVIHAATTTSGNNRLSALVNAIAQKFNLNPTDVQQVVDQTEAAQKQQMQAQMQQSFTDRINQAVKDGKITQTQADKILAKEQEVQTFTSSLSGKSEADRQTAMQTEMDSLKQWATDNSISTEYMPSLMGGRGGHGPGMGMRPSAAGTVSAISGNTITLTGKNNTTYTVDATNATVTKFTAGASGSRPVKTTIQVSDIKVGDSLAVQGTVSGNAVTATQITDGALMDKGFGRMKK